MRRNITILAVLTLCSALSVAGPLSFGVQATGGGISVAGSFKDVYSSGFGGGAHIDLDLPVLLSLRLSGDYVVFSPDQDKYRQALATLLPGNSASGFTIDGGKINILAFSLNGKVALPTPVLSPYLTAGVGTATFSGGSISVSYNGQPLGNTPGVPTETDASVNVGAGVDWKLVLTLYLEVKYTVAFTSGSSSSFTMASLGITF